MDDNRTNEVKDDYGDGFYVDDNTVSSRSYVAEEPEEQGSNRRIRIKKRKSFISRLLTVLVIIVVIMLSSVMAVVGVILMRINYTNEMPDHNVAENQGITLMSKNGVQNIMVFGEDKHEEGYHGRSDAMILITIDSNNNKLKQTSFLRDLYLFIPGYGYDKLNAAYAYGGPALSVETIEYNFHIKIDDYIIIDFNSFTDIVDSLGGLDMNLTYEEVEYIDWQSYRNKQTDSEKELNADNYSYELNDDGDYVTKIHLNGRQALWYARNRDSAGSDFDRAWRQRMVIDTVLSKLKSADPFRLSAVGISVSPYVTTNMSPAAVTGKAASLIGALNWDREQYRVPQRDNYYDQWTDNAGLALVITDEDKARKELTEFIFGE